MACFIIGAGSFYGLPVSVQRTDMVIAADGSWHTCRENGITPTLLVATSTRWTPRRRLTTSSACRWRRMTPT